MKREDIIKTANSLKGEEGHQKVLSVYNDQKPLPRGYKVKSTDAWCATFTTAVFLMNGYSDIAECSCPQMIEKAKKLGIWVEDDAFVPKIGDVIMYDWQDNGRGDDVGVADHVGIIISVSKNKIVVREGNKNKSIGNRDVLVDGLYIRGYITPPYEDRTNQKTSQKAKKKPEGSQEASTPAKSSESKKKQEKGQGAYVVGSNYVIRVKSALNVRTGPGTNYPLVGYNNLTADGKKHAYRTGSLKPNTIVTCKEVKTLDSKNVWIRIPSGWVCAISGNNVYVD